MLNLDDGIEEEVEEDEDKEDDEEEDFTNHIIVNTSDRAKIEG